MYKFGSFDAGAEPVLGFDKKEWLRICTELRRLRRAVKLRQQPDNVEVPLQVSQIVETLPPRQACDVLVQNYLRTLEPIYRILNVPQFLQDLDQFWEKRTEACHKVSLLQSILSSTKSFHQLTNWYSRLGS